MHSWVGYKLVKVLLIFGLDLKICDDLEDWSPDLFNLFSYMGDKKRSTKKEEDNRLLTILFQKTLHSGYFAKLPFGSKANFEKNAQYYINIGHINVVAPTARTFLRD
jgi:hypothetical protein